MNKNSVSEKWAARSPELRSVLRIVAAFMFMQAGAAKLFAFPVAILPGGKTVALASQVGVGGVLELVGGALILIGLFTRPVAFLLAGEMAVAYFQVHFPKGFWPVANGGVTAALYCFIWLYISAAGAGPWSVDAKRAR
jgi:putative oxidoreductase